MLHMSSNNSYPIKTALISVSNKTGIVDFAKSLSAMNVHILSTGGTASELKAAGITVQDVSDYTGLPEMMSGRVKTLHPKVHGGILARRNNAEDLAAMQAHSIIGIDMVVLNLYPFASTVESGTDYAEIIENIDIGGPAMLRAAAKNHQYVSVVTSPNDYDDVLQAMQAAGGDIGFAKRQALAAKAFAHVASYDARVSSWFASQLGQSNPETLNLGMQRAQELRYGENPHQQAAFYRISNAHGTLATAQQLHGKELSYNNINDTDAAWCLVCELPQPSIAIIKHANPCGVATGATLLECYEKALKCDPQSAYGGIIAVNVEMDSETAEQIAKLFAEVVIAPSYSPAALEILQTKKNVRLLHTHGALLPDSKTPQLRSVSGGVLVQGYDDILLQGDIEIAGECKPNDATMQDLIFAFAVAKHVKSNAIVLVKDGATVGIGAGQMSRIDSVRLSCLKAERAGLSTIGAVLASDAFFPFDDNVHQAAEAGIAAIIQPGGSIRDDEVIKAANEHNMALCFTGIRHFKH
jgi:phosphoribosylaminoimidazolecarboxamide formyltransferase / IMP cyclohydrolase